MANTSDNLFEVLLDSWERNNVILLNLLNVLTPADLRARAIEGGPSVGQLFTHIHFVRLIFISEDAPDFARSLPEQEWADERDAARIAEMLKDSANAVRAALKHKVQSGQAMDIHYDHPILFLQHMVWHEGYHHGQIKLALKMTGREISDKEIGPVTWGVWMRKS